jgi:hypothetical protein
VSPSVGSWAMHNVALLSHKPSDKTKAYIKSLPGTWKVWHYVFNCELQKDLLPYILEIVTEIHQAVDLQHCGRILLAPPGLSPAVFPMCEAIRGLSGIKPDILVLMRGADGQYAPCGEKPVIEQSDLDELYSYFRSQRNGGMVLL